ncbi:hypothetical protein OG757_23570 [Streptomyces sp. NBC_01262]
MTAVAVTISEAFSEYLKTKIPKSWEREEVTKFRTRINEILSAEYGLLGFFQSGSFSNGTGISLKSDVDYMAWIPIARKTTYSSSTLEAMKSLLTIKLWEASSIWTSRPTVSIDFRGIVTQYEVTPAFYEREANGHIIYSISGPNNTWRESAPKAHLAYVRDIDQKRNGKVKGLARLLKAWKYEHDVPVSSFYLEMRAAEYGASNDSIIYPSALPSLMRKMVNHELRSMNDPAGLVNRISACSSELKRTTSIRAMQTALGHLDTAFSKWTVDNYAASQELRIVFGSDFPFVF